MTIFYLNFLRVLAIFFVVFLHTSSHFLNHLNSFNTVNQVNLIFFDVISRFCVPAFFLISGALLLNKKEKILVFYRKRLKKIIPPFLFWCVFYYFWSKKNFHIDKDILFCWLKIPYYHLWFVQTILVVYLLTPFLRLILKLKLNLQLVIMIIMSLATLIYFFYFPNSKKISVSFFYATYFLIGHFLNRLKINKRQSFFFIFGLVFSFLLQTILAYFDFLKTGSIENYYREYFSFFVFFNSIAIFLLVKFYFENRESVNKRFLNLINYISGSTFFIYFIHIFILDIFWLLRFETLNILIFIEILFFTFFALIISIYTNMLFKKILNLVKTYKYSKITKRKL